MIRASEDEFIRLIFDVRQVLRGDWAGPILVVLRRGSMQYRDLRDEMAQYSVDDRWTGKERTLSNSELARTLSRMTQDGLLTRTETPGEWRSAVSYELSAVGRELTDQFIPVLRWAAGQPEFFLRALQQRGSRGEGRPAASEQEPPTPLSS